MGNYDLSVLSPDEFELLCKDLLEAEREMKFENFKAGKDGGIDLRHTTNTDESIIVQCKRYTDFDSLKYNLKKEVSKVEKLNPKQYIVMTSVGLSPDYKTQIKNIFSDYIKSTSDIIGGDEIKSLLGNHKDVERKHYKLWLASTNVLHSIVNNNIMNRSEFSKQQIKNKLKIYVQNNSFPAALQILNKDGFLILSGSPGVGKTTLAEVLSFNFSAKGYEFFEISDDIEEAEKVYVDNQKQIFYYDDFLGRNFLEKNLSKNEDRRLLNFISKVVSNPKKKFIMTTREYILRQAQQKHDLLKDKKFDINKHIINIEDYSKYIKAKILYNHLYFSEVPNSHIKKIIEEKTFYKIIRHKNYNPRIISLMTDKMIIENISVGNYPNEFLKKLDYPNEIWEEVLDNHIEESALYILLLLMVMEEVSELEKLQNNFKNLNAYFNYRFDNRDFKKGIKKLEKTFLKIFKEKNSNKDIVGFQNPSVKDFLIDYSSKDSQHIELMWQTTLYLKPLLKNFSVNNVQGKIKVPLSLMKKLVKILGGRFENFEDCKSDEMKLRQLKGIDETFPIENYEELIAILIRVFKGIVKPHQVDVESYLFFLEKYEIFLSEHLNYKELLRDIITNSQIFIDLEQIIFIKDSFSEIFEELSAEVDITMILKSVCKDVSNELFDYDSGELERIIDIFEEVSSTFNLDVSDYIANVESTIWDLEHYSREEDFDEDYGDYYSERQFNEDEDEAIYSLFTTLLED